MTGVAHSLLRANPGYELVLVDRLSAREREVLGGEGDLYGVLRPRAGVELEPRTASADTALLFLTLREPSELPGYVRNRLGEDSDSAIARLVVDEVLQIQRGGQFVSGPRAAGTMLAGDATGGRGRIGVLSLAALRNGQELGAVGLAEEQLASRLYCYGRVPLTAALAERFDAAAIDAYLGAGSTAWGAAEGSWVQTTPTSAARAYWRSWRARRQPVGAGRWEGGYKLYVSPALDVLWVAFGAVVGSLVGARGVKAFKMGADVPGLCRPDKLVVYFDRLEDLQEGAQKLRRELEGAPAHGVPFTAAVTPDGLLSWGADPPAFDGLQTSWRDWVCRRLAEYLLLGGSAELEPWQLALERLRLAGVDTDTWIPANDMWARALATA